jgi:hypothetical protein
VASVPQRLLGASGMIVPSWVVVAAAADPLGRQQPFPPQQAQDPFAADVHAVLAAQPNPDLAVALPGKG